MVPKDEDELADMMYTAMLHDGPSAIRYPRGTGPGVKVKEQPKALEIGMAEVVKDGHDVAIFGLGAMLPEAQRLAAMLEREGFSAAVINPRFAKPIDRECVAEFGAAMRAADYAGGSCAGGRVRVGGAGDAERTGACQFRWCGWDGRMRSSSTARWRRCARNMG